MGSRSEVLQPAGWRVSRSEHVGDPAFAEARQVGGASAVRSVRASGLKELDPVNVPSPTGGRTLASRMPRELSSSSSVKKPAQALLSLRISSPSA